MFGLCVMWSIKVYLTLLEATIVLWILLLLLVPIVFSVVKNIHVVVVGFRVVVYGIVVTLLIVADHFIFSEGQ